MGDCGDPIQAELRGMPGLCYNDSSKLTWLKDVVHLVKHHPALLGYYSKFCQKNGRCLRLLGPLLTHLWCLCSL